MAPTSLEGQTLGKYRILEPLGRGGMAQVYKAYHPQLDRYVAVKVMRSDLVEEEEFLARFRHEARAVAALRHPNVVQVYDFDAQDDIYYMVMELLEGDTLKSAENAFRAGGARMPIGEALRILLDVLAGLEYAHAEGIVHRDIKPANIMLTRRGQAVLTDFGIAQIVGNTRYTVSGALMGTLNYMAPEQGMSGQCDARSDLYSLGIVYFELLTGQVPFDADTPLAILMKHVNDPLPLPHRIDGSIPEPFERVALKALAKQPEERYQTAREMADALKEAAEIANIQIADAITPSAPRLGSAAGNVGIFSGTARQNIADDDFAREDTDTTLKEKLHAAPSPLDESKVFRSLSTLLKVPEQVTDSDIRPWDVSRAATVAALTLVLINICGIWLSGMAGWDFFSYAWPMELVLIAVIVSALMAALPNVWLLIPAGLFLGHAILFTYSSLTGFWNHWLFLWPFSPAFIALPIVAAIWINKRGLHGLYVARRLGVILLVLSAALLGLILVASTILAVIN